MRSTALILGLLVAGCGTQETRSPSLKPSSAAAGSATATADASVESPLHVVLQSKTKITLAGVSDGVWISDGAGKQLAQAKGDDELTAGPMPAGLPERWGRILNVSGLLRNVWVSLELEEKGAGNLGKTPLYRFDGKEYRRIDEDWRPLVTIYKGGLPLAIWSSAGRLKAKMPLHHPETPDDLPGAELDDPSCSHNLRLDAIAGLPTGEVFGVGSCSPTGGRKRRSVVVKWPADESAKPDAGAAAAATASATAQAAAPSATPTAAPTAAPKPSVTAAPSASMTAAPSATAPTAVPSASPVAASAEAADTPAAPTDPVEPEKPTGVAGHVMVLPAAERSLSHRSLLAIASNDVLVAGVDLDSTPTPKSYLWRFDGSIWQPLELPSQEQLVGVAQSADGTLWLATEHAMWTKAKDGWQPVVLPGVEASDAKWTYLAIFAVDGTVWVAAQRGSDSYVVLRNKPPKQKITW